MNVEQLKQQIRELEESIESNKAEIAEMDKNGISDPGYHQSLCEGVGEMEEEWFSLQELLDEYLAEISGEQDND